MAKVKKKEVYADAFTYTELVEAVKAIKMGNIDLRDCDAIIHGVRITLEKNHIVLVTPESTHRIAEISDEIILIFSSGNVATVSKPAFETHYGNVDENQPTEKTLGNTTVNGARKNVKDIVVYGDGDTFKLICKASSQNEGWMKSTKAMTIPGVGTVVQVTTQQRNPDGSYALAVALTFVPFAKVQEINGNKENGREIVAMNQGVTVTLG